MSFLRRAVILQPGSMFKTSSFSMIASEVIDSSKANNTVPRKRKYKERPKAQDYKILSPLKMGDPLLNINYMKEPAKDPTLLQEDQYPGWIWDALNPLEKPILKKYNDILTRKDLRDYNKFKIKLNNIKAQSKKF